MEEKDIKQIKRKKATIETLIFILLNYIGLIPAALAGPEGYKMLMVHAFGLFFLIGPILFIIYMVIIWKDLKKRNLLAKILLIIFISLRLFVIGVMYSTSEAAEVTIPKPESVSKPGLIDKYTLKNLEIIFSISQFFAFVIIEKIFEKKIDKENKENKKVKRKINGRKG